MSPPSMYESAILCASRSSLARTFVNHLHDRCGIAIGSRVIVAVSGGPDSVALAVLSAAVSLRRTPAEIVPIIAHVDHGLRKESADEATMVRELARGLSVESLFRKVAVVSEGKGISAAARDARYDALLSMAHEANAVAVLTGHHADDQSETVLLAMARGSGVAGISGMPFSRPLSKEVSLCRPLLSQRGASLEKLVNESGLAYCTDPGNRDPESPRAVVRHEVLPLLERLHPGASERISELANDVRTTLSEAGSSSAVRWRRSALKTIGDSECAATIRNASVGLDPRASSCSRTHWQSVVDMIRADAVEPRAIEITKGLAVVVDSEEVRFTESASHE